MLIVDAAIRESSEVADRYASASQSSVGWTIPVVLSSALQAAYDFGIKLSFKLCARRKREATLAGRIALALARRAFEAVALLAAVPAIIALAGSNTWELTLGTWGLSKALSLGIINNVVIYIMFHRKRRRDGRQGCP